jgi:hypothetical protein
LCFRVGASSSTDSVVPSPQLTVHLMTLPATGPSAESFNSKPTPSLIDVAPLMVRRVGGNDVDRHKQPIAWRMLTVFVGGGRRDFVAAGTA